MDDTWSWRDLPVLDAVVSLVDEGAAAGSEPEVPDIAARCGLAEQEVATALLALQGEFLDLVTPMGGPAGWFVRSVTPAARREAGQWPTGESLVERLAAGIAEAAGQEPDPEQKSRLLAVARELGGAVKAVAVNVATQMIEHKTGGRL